jgi:glucosamine--fructose-6-phosphate aminotransferase (isomerizing)
MGVINTVGSMIANSVHCGVYLNCGREVAVPATKSFTCQIVVLTMIGIFISHLKDKKNVQ